MKAARTSPHRCELGDPVCRRAPRAQGDSVALSCSGIKNWNKYDRQRVPGDVKIERGRGGCVSCRRQQQADIASVLIVLLMRTTFVGREERHSRNRIPRTRQTRTWANMCEVPVMMSAEDASLQDERQKTQHHTQHGASTVS